MNPEYLSYLDNLEGQFGLPKGLLATQQKAESNFNPNAVSPVGAQGIAQLMPETAKQYGVDPFDPMQAAQGQARMMSELMGKYNGDITKALAAYNWGQGNVDRKGMQNAPKETRNYIAKIAGQLGSIPVNENVSERRQFSGIKPSALESFMDVVGSAIIPSANAEELPPLPEGYSFVDDDATQQNQQSQGLPPFPEGYSFVDEKQIKQNNFEKQSVLRTIADQAAQGITFGTADEIGAGLESLFTGKPYKNVVNETRQRLELQKQQRPILSAVSDIGGSLVTPGLALAKFAKYSPTAFRSLQMFAEGKPILSGGIVGGATGALRGAGEGTDEESRISGAGTGAVLGGGFGAAGTALVGSVANAVGKTLRNKAAQQAANVTPEEAAPLGSISQRPIAESKTIEELASEQGNAIRLPKGVREGDKNLLRTQEEARQGLLGIEAQAAIKKIDDAVKEDVAKATQSLVGDNANEADDLLMKGIGDFKKRAMAEQRKAGALMNERNAKIAEAKIFRQYTNQTLGEKVKSVINDPQSQVFMSTPDAAGIKSRIKYLNNLIKEDPEGKFQKPIEMAKLQGWSSDMGAYARANKGKPESVIANRLVEQYNDWLQNITKSAFKDMDDSVVDSILKANQNYASFKKMFGTDKYRGQSKIIENIIKQDELTPRQLVNTVFGSGVGGKDVSGQVVGRMIKAMPEKRAEQMKTDFRAGLLMRAYEKSRTADGNIKLGNFSSAINQLRQNDVYKTHLMDKTYDDALKNLSSDINAYVRALNDPTVRSTSGTGGAVGRMMKKVLDNPAISRLTAGTSTQLEKFLNEAANATKRSDVRKIEREFFGQLYDAINSRKTSYKDAIVGGTIGGATGSELARPKLQIEIRKGPNEKPLPDVDLPSMNYKKENE